eukprot:3255407-Prymnesium_polylepis.1
MRRRARAAPSSCGAPRARPAAARPAARKTAGRTASLGTSSTARAETSARPRSRGCSGSSRTRPQATRPPFLGRRRSTARRVPSALCAAAAPPR